MGAALTRLLLLIQVSVIVILNGWFTLKIGQTVYKVLTSNSLGSPTAQPNIIRHTSQSQSGHQISVRKSKNQAKWTLIFTFISCLFFLLSMICTLMGNLVMLSHIGWWNNTRWHNLDHRSQSVGKPYRYTSMLFQLVGYSALIVCCYMRLRNIFKHSQFALSPLTTRSIEGIIIGGMILVFVAVAVHFWISPPAAVFVALGTIIAYPCIAIWCAFRFLNTSMKIARNVSRSAQANSLLNASLRLSILTIISIFSSIVTCFAFILSVFTTDVILLTRLFAFLWNFDAVINAACLMVMLRNHAQWYHCMLGCLHTTLLSWLMNRTHRTDLTNINHSALPPQSPIVSMSTNNSL